MIFYLEFFAELLTFILYVRILIDPLSRLVVLPSAVLDDQKKEEVSEIAAWERALIGTDLK